MKIILPYKFHPNNLWAGERTEFHLKIKAEQLPKRHAIVVFSKEWYKNERIVNSSVYPLNVFYERGYENNPDITLIDSFPKIAVQTFVFPMKNDKVVMVEGIPVPIETFARNEGLTVEQFRSLYKWYAELEAMVVHFGNYRYE